MRDQETIDKIYKWADKNRIKYNSIYQMDGSPSAMKTYEKYDDICDICLAAQNGISEEDKTKKHIHRNQIAQIDQLKDLQKVSPGKTFTYEEVEQWMRRMMV